MEDYVQAVNMHIHINTHYMHAYADALLLCYTCT